jgi:hypothetical protein
VASIAYVVGFWMAQGTTPGKMALRLDHPRLRDLVVPALVVRVPDDPQESGFGMTTRWRVRI